MRPAGPLPAAAGVTLLRPLLGWRKAQLAEVVADAGLAAADDPSNRDPRHARAKVRAWLDRTGWLDPAALAATAAHCADAEEAITWSARIEWSERVAATGAGLAYAPQAPRAIRLRVLERVVCELGGEGAPRGNEVARWLSALEAGRVATLGGVRGNGSSIPWLFARAPSRRG
jgi:tRNA(Ile)-lysidine synthase